RLRAPLPLTANERCRAFFDRSAAVYRGSYRTSGYWNRSSFERHARLLHAFASPDATPLLDAGCGTGALAEPLTRAGTPVIGVDYSMASVACAPRHGLKG